MRPYEVVIILDTGLEDAAVKAAVDRSSELVSSRGGTVNRVEMWGKRRFAYQINHKSEGIYVLFDVTAESTVMDDLDRALRLADDVVRHKIVRIPDHVAGRPRRLAESEQASATAESES